MKQETPKMASHLLDVHRQSGAECMGIHLMPLLPKIFPFIGQGSVGGRPPGSVEKAEVGRSLDPDLNANGVQNYSIAGVKSKIPINRGPLPTHPHSQTQWEYLFQQALPVRPYVVLIGGQPSAYVRWIKQ